MVFSRFLKIYPCKDKNSYLLYSTKQASKILIPEETYTAAQKNRLDPEDEKLLTELGMLVSSHENEKKEMLNFLDRTNEHNKTLSIIVVLNLDCNFDCTYCFEGTLKGDLYMSDEIEDMLIAVIKKRFTKNMEKIIIDFYGGEPLLSMDRIRNISQRVKALVKNRGECEFGMITNGSLLTRKKALELKSLGIERAQITLDGPSETHNQTRPFKNCKGSFNRVIKNIKESCDLIKINLSGNFSKSTYKKFPLLFDVLEKEGITSDKINLVKFSPIMKQCDSVSKGNSCSKACVSTDEPWLWEAGNFLREEILKRGYNTTKLKPSTCAIENRDDFIINFDGDIYKCPAFNGNKEFVIGNLKTGIKNYDRSHKTGIWKNDKCLECAYLPICFGGCRYMEYLRTGKIDKPDCKKTYYDACLENTLIQDMRYSRERPYKPLNTEDDKKIKLNDLVRAIDAVMAKYFLPQFMQFKPPHIKRIVSFYLNTERIIDAYVLNREKKRQKGFDCSAFIAVTAIRYVDDFIDNCLWPDIDAYDPKELSKRFGKFLVEALEAVRGFDPDMPETIIKLPLLEMKLALFPGQDLFDKNFKQLIRHKSYDLAYVYNKINQDGEKLKPNDLLKLAVIDYLRDFTDKEMEEETDFNLYMYVRDNKLDPEQLIAYLNKSYRDAVKRDNGIFDKTFGELFNQAIFMLERLRGQDTKQKPQKTAFG